MPSSNTPTAGSAEEVAKFAYAAKALDVLDDRISVCRACPRLVSWREEVAVKKRRSFIDDDYWGRPVTGFGPTDAQIVILGLAPAAHGANRTGRVFTGDESGNWLFASLHRVGLAKIATSTSSSDGQELINVRLLTAVRCAPPANAPTIAERDNCKPWLVRELELLTQANIYVALGAFGWDALLSTFTGIPKPKPKFGHGAQVELPDGRILLASYHPSQQNTFTGRLTEKMLDDVLGSAATLANR
ncbi:MAG TPA: uracil-DNA glycosylase [Candidatus Nanopelagicaceae bacterium]|nr:uracil-DNA glycosylase [Candidatus Nanopelagicaceae bacterium]